MSDSLPRMPWYPRDFWSATQHWPFEARCVYRELLDLQWDIGYIPNDPKTIRKTRAIPLKFWRVFERFGLEKFSERDGVLVNEKLEEHRNKALMELEKRRSAGSLGGQASAQARAQAHGQAPRTRTITNKEKNTTAASRPSDQDFEAFKRVYPKRAGSQPWSRAKKAIHARLREGTEMEEIIDGAERYRQFCETTGKIHTEHVMQAATFCGPDKHFEADWKQPVDRSNGDDSERHRRQILELASILHIDRGEQAWDSFEAKVTAANERRLASLSH